MASDPFKSDFLTTNLQPISGTKLSFGQQDSYGQSGFGSMNLGGHSNAADRRRAGDMVSDLLDKQKELKSSDPFSLLKDLTTANAMQDKGSA